MKTLISLFIVSIIFCNTLYAQPLIWRAVPTFPTQLGEQQIQDVYFVNPMTGWVCGRGIYKTTNGAISWQIQSDYASGGIGGRCIGFFNDQNGFAGSYQNYQIPSFLYRTTNGGTNWFPVMDLPVNLDSNGVCGMYIVNSQIGYILGRWDRPAVILKTTNAGNNWFKLNVNNLATGLISARFFSPDTGFVVGHTGISNQGNDYRTVVLYTANGGVNWTTVHSGSRDKEFCWKISFPTRQTGYVSVYDQHNLGKVFLKTTNGGMNWQELPFSRSKNEGIGFVSSDTGWMDSEYGFSICQKTTNGGLNWSQESALLNVNKFIFLSDTLGYAVGATLYKYSHDSISSIKTISTEIPETPYLSQNFPNPFNPSTKIRFYLATALHKHVELTIYDNTGKKLEILVNQSLMPGGHEVEWNAINYPSGVYYYKLTVGSYTETRKMLLVK